MYVHEHPARVTVRLLFLKALSPSLFSRTTVVWEGKERKQNETPCIVFLGFCGVLYMVQGMLVVGGERML
jgi:hypothetical protein